MCCVVCESDESDDDLSVSLGVFISVIRVSEWTLWSCFQRETACEHENDMCRKCRSAVQRCGCDWA